MTRKLKIGMVCPYGWDTPGGVQIHIKELAQYFMAQGHEVSVFAPVSDDSTIQEPWLVSAGRPVSIPFNGAVARISFGPVASSRVRQWIANGNFDLLHLHEPAIPSLSLLACWSSEGPMVGTFHAASAKQKAIYAIGPILEPVLEKLTARIAVSEMARQTLKDHFETEAVVIPNGINGAKLRAASANPQWQSGRTIGFIGRFTEPRKGLEILLAAMPIVAKAFPDVKLLIAGPGDESEISKSFPPGIRDRTKFLGRLSEEEKASFFKSVEIYVAPNTGGESFGIILAEAMAAGTPIVASDIPAFSQLLVDGQYGALFASENPKDLARSLIELLRDQKRRSDLSSRASEYAEKFEWETVAEQIMSVYELALVGNNGVSLGSENRVWNRRRLQ